MRFRILLVFGLSSACNGGTVQAVSPELFLASPTYEGSIQFILRDRCVACHDSHGKIAGGVELDTYASAYSNRVRNACVSITPALVDRFAEVLMPHPTNPPTEQVVCNDWEPLTMPNGAEPLLTPAEQVLLVRWVEIGAPLK